MSYRDVLSYVLKNCGAKGILGDVEYFRKKLVKASSENRSSSDSRNKQKKAVLCTIVCVSFSGIIAYSK